MTDREVNIRDAFVAMREFNNRNGADYAAIAAAVASFNIIDGVIAVLDDLSAAQTSGARGLAVEKKSVIAAAMRRKMTAMARTARALNLDDPGFRRLFSVPNDNSYPKLLSAAREFVEEGNLHKDAMIALAMSPTLIDELSADIAAFDAAADDKADAQGGKVGATAGIDAEIERGMKAAKILDAIMKNVYDNNPSKLAEWTQARHIRRSPRKKPDQPPSA